jgi:hypothetical protein
MDVYLCLKDENRSLHKEKLHYLGTPFLKQVYIYITVIPMATVYMATSYTKH